MRSSRYVEDSPIFNNRSLGLIHGYLNGPKMRFNETIEIIKLYTSIGSEHVNEALHSYNRWNEHGLDQDETAAVYIYTMEMGPGSLYRVLNTTLRSENREILKLWFPFLRLFVNALKKLPLFKGNAWRGIDCAVGRNYPNETSFIWEAFSSCSPNLDLIQHFLGDKCGSVFLIEVANARDLTGYSKYKGEHEILLLPDTSFNVRGRLTKEIFNLHIIHLVQLAIPNSGDVKPMNISSASRDSITTMYTPSAPPAPQYPALATSSPMNPSYMSDEKFEEIYGSKSDILVDRGQILQTFGYLVSNKYAAVGRNQYTNGVHSIRLQVQMSEVFIGIISREQNNPKPPDYVNTPTTYGWWGKNYEYVNGKETKLPEWTKLEKDDIFELTIDCDKRKLNILNWKSRDERTLDIGERQAPFPWRLFVVTGWCDSRVRLCNSD